MQDFCIQITKSTLPIVKKWWDEAGGGEKAWSLGAHYGMKNGELRAYNAGAWTVPIELEEFLEIIKPDKVINNYLIY